MKEKVRFLGLDVHAETIAVAVAEPDGEVPSLGTIAKHAYPAQPEGNPSATRQSYFEKIRPRKVYPPRSPPGVFLLRRAWSTSPRFHTTLHIAVAPFL